jgi:hypothetical protein
LPEAFTVCALHPLRGAKQVICWALKADTAPHYGGPTIFRIDLASVLFERAARGLLFDPFGSAHTVFSCSGVS